MDLIELSEHEAEEVLGEGVAVQGSLQRKKRSKNRLDDHKGWCIDILFCPPLPTDIDGYAEHMKKAVEGIRELKEIMPHFLKAYFGSSRLEIDPIGVRFRGGPLRIVAGSDGEEYRERVMEFYKDGTTDEYEVFGRSSFDFPIVVEYGGNISDLHEAESAVKNLASYMKGFIGPVCSFSIIGYPLSQITRYEMPQESVN